MTVDSQPSLDEVRYEVADHVATITLDAPERMNTISGPMLMAISQHLLAADRDPDVRCVVITGSGRAFCAGLDLAAQAADRVGGLGNLGSPGAGGGELDVRRAPPVVLHQMDTPTVCALNGGAAGYGLDLALGCDIRIAGCLGQAQPRVRQARHPPGERRHVAAAADDRLRQGRRDLLPRAAH